VGPRTVRDAAFDAFRRHGLTSLFANPGSTEISLLADLPGDLRFVLGLHESSVVGMATGFAIGRGEPALAILHTTAGLGNAVGALATAREGYERASALAADGGDADATARIGVVDTWALGRSARAVKRERDSSTECANSRSFAGPISVSE